MDRNDPPHHAREAVAALGERLRALRYDETHLRIRTGGRFGARITPGTVAVVARRAGDDDLAAAIRFWYLGMPAHPDAVERMHEGIPLGALVAAGLAELGDGLANPRLRIGPHGRLLIAHDPEDASPLAADHVLGVGIATRTLASLTPRHHVERALDVGTGSGAQALLASSHADHVVATDLNERAVWMTRLSAALSGIDAVDAIDVRLGDALVPVRGETFDLIVSNPPFVVSPDRDLVFRDSGSSADDASRDLVRGVVPHLRAGGMACLLVNWVVRKGEDESAAPRDWVSDLGCDALILHHDTRDPLGYTERWAMVPPSAPASTHTELIERWLDHFEHLGADAIASGAVILRVPDAGTGRSRTRVERMPRRPDRGGEHVERMLASLGRFEGADDPALARTVFRLIHGHHVEQRLDYGHGSYTARDAVLRLDRSAGVLGTIPPELLELVLGLDGRRSLRSLAQGLARARGEPAAELIDRAAALLHRLLEQGLVETVD